jgi:WD40 repeat protein
VLITFHSGNDQGNIILFDPTTKEHMSRKTIYDPITSLAPSIDCKTFAIGYANGSILVAALHPSFTMIHTLSTQRQPSPINQLAWHGSSSKSKSDMLASQTMDGDLRVWSIPKGSNTEPPSVIRNFQQGGMERTVGGCWFGWSKMGRIVQHIDR